MHLSDHDLERYHLRMVEEPELTVLEEHLLGCPACAERAEQSAVWVDAIRAAAAKAELDRWSRSSLTMQNYDDD